MRNRTFRRPRPAPIGHNGVETFETAAELPDGLNKMQWFPLDIQALRKVLFDLPLDQRGFYISALVAMYEHMEPLPADDNIARMRLGMDIRAYRRHRDAFVRAGHLTQKPSGRISNNRFEAEVAAYVSEYRNRQKGWEKRVENTKGCTVTTEEIVDRSSIDRGDLREIYPLANGQLNGHLSEKPNEINGGGVSIQSEVSLTSCYNNNNSNSISKRNGTKVPYAEVGFATPAVPSGQPEMLPGMVQDRPPDPPLTSSADASQPPPPRPPKIHPMTQHVVGAIEAYNFMASHSGLSKVIIRLNPNREGMLKARLGEVGGIEGWQRVIDKIAASNFLLGQNKTGWRVTFDWLIKPQNFAKVAGGNYDNRSAAVRPQPQIIAESTLEAELALAREQDFGGSSRWRN